MNCVRLQNRRGSSPSGYVSPLPRSFLAPVPRGVARCHAGKRVPSRHEVREIESKQLALDVCVNTGRIQLCDKGTGINERTRAHGGNRRRLSKFAGWLWKTTMSHCSGPAHTDAANRPPGRSTHAIYRPPASRSRTYIILRQAGTTSKTPASAGMLSARSSSSSRLRSSPPSTRLRTSASISTLTPSPTTQPLGRTATTVRSATAPVTVTFEAAKS